MEQVKGYVHSIETLGAVDGPGLRFVLFLQGCPLRCKFCHNPDTWRTEGGEEYTVEEMVSKILRYRNYIKSGGVTISGGEPLRQAEFCLALTRALHEEGIHVAIDTSGIYCEGTALEAALEADLILLDIKSFDSDKAKALTGFSTDHAWQLLRARQEAGERTAAPASETTPAPASESTSEFTSETSLAQGEKNVAPAPHKKPVWIRHVMVPGITLIDTKPDGQPFSSEEEWRSANAELIDGIRRMNDYSCIERVDLLPFHKMGEYKYEELHFPYELTDTKEPTDEVIEWAENALKEVRQSHH